MRDWSGGLCHEGALTFAAVEATLEPGSTKHALELIAGETRIHARLATLLQYAIDGIELENFTSGTSTKTTPIRYELTSDSRQLIERWIASKT